MAEVYKSGSSDLLQENLALGNLSILSGCQEERFRSNQDIFFLSHSMLLPYCWCKDFWFKLCSYFKSQLILCFVTFLKLHSLNMFILWVDKGKDYSLRKKMLQGNPCLCISLYINLKLLSFFFFWISVPCEINVFQWIKEWFQIGEGVPQGCILLPYLFNLYTEYIMRNTGLEEAQAGIKIARRKI